MLVHNCKKQGNFLSNDFGQFSIKELVEKISIRLELPGYFKIYTIVNVIQTTPCCEQMNDIAALIPERPEPVRTIEGEEHVINAILSHRKRGHGYQFLILMKEDPTREAQWHGHRTLLLVMELSTKCGTTTL